MIIQTIKQGENVIRIENAESLEDAKENKFKDGEYSRYFVNDQPVSNYMSLIKYIVAESAKANKPFIPDKKNSIKLRKELFDNQKKEIKKQFENVKQYYSDKNMDKSFFKNIDDMIEKVNEIGIRVVK